MTLPSQPSNFSALFASGIACRQTMSLLTVPPVRYTTVGSYKLPDPDLIA